MRDSSTPAPAPDRFRGTLQRWSIDEGPLAGSMTDYAFNDDGSLTWRVVAGPDQGRAGRARSFGVQAVRSQLFIVTFAIADAESVTATLDFASRRLAGFHRVGAHARPMSGIVRTM